MGRAAFGVTAVVVVLGERVDPGPLVAFEFGYVGGDGVEQRLPLDEVGQVAGYAAL